MSRQPTERVIPRSAALMAACSFGISSFSLKQMMNDGDLFYARRTT